MLKSCLLLRLEKRIPDTDPVCLKKHTLEQLTILMNTVFRLNTVDLNFLETYIV